MKKHIKLKELLEENSIALGYTDTPVIGDISFRKHSIYEEDEAEDDDSRKLLFGQDDDEKESELTSEMKKAFYEYVSKFHTLGDSIYRDRALKEITKNVMRIGQLAEKIALSESDDWFDTQTVQRDMKSLNESMKLFEKTAKDVNGLQMRLESLYEDIGQKLGRYFPINQNAIKESKIKKIKARKKK